MPLQYPNPYNPYQEPRKPTNWPKIILITLAIVIIIAGVYLAVKTFSEKRGDNNEGIAVGEPNPNDNNSAGGTVPAGSGPYNCDTDTYNCADFTTRAEAQTAFDQCSSQGFGDVHQLDNDGDGRVCESLAQ